MLSTPNKLLATVLALILVCVPLGNALAAGDACEGTGVAMTQMDHGQHLESSQAVTSDMKDSEDSSTCQCCADHACYVCACGTAVTVVSHVSAQPERMRGIFNDVSGDRESSDRQTPPFKPPRV